MRFLKDTLKLFVHEIRWLVVIWAITILSYNCAINPSEGTAIKRALTLKQRPDFLRLETGSDRQLKFAVNILAVEVDYDILKLEHFVQPDPGDPTTGIVIHSDFPQRGRLIEVPTTIHVNYKVTGVTPGRYTITTTATIRHKKAVKPRETISAELLVVVVKPGTPEPLVLNKPLISPSAVPPAFKLTKVAFGTSIVGPSTPPQILYLDEVTSTGRFISVQAQLRDDGKGPDKKSGDRFYSATLKLGGKEETETYFRLRAEYFGETIVSGIAVFPVTRLPLGYRPSARDTLIDSDDGQDKVFTNEVIIGTPAGVSPGLVRKIVAAVGGSLEFEPDAIGIAGYLPSIHSYLVEFEGDGTLKVLNRAISAFNVYTEIAYASPNFQGRPAAQWFLDHVGIDKLRLGAGSPPPVGPPLYGSASIGVAIMEAGGVDCSHADLSGKCATAGELLSTCGAFSTTGSGLHATKVAALVAGQGDNVATVGGVDGGVAWETRLFPFLVDSTWALNLSIDCAVNAGAIAGLQVIHILNISREYFNPPPGLQTSVCNAVCNNMLVVAAAGNYACPPPDGTGDNIDRYPAAYDVGTTCPCGPAGESILRVGATDSAKNRGDACAAFDKKSKLGDVYAPGWGIPVDGSGAPSSNFATSWSAPLVSGCAAVRGAVQQWKGVSWDANAVETRLRTNSFGTPPLLNCLAAVADSYDIVFVLDRSGSMGLTTNIDTALATDRWDALKIAAAEFTSLISASAPPQSNFGLTLFAGTVLPNPLSAMVAIDPNLTTNVSTVLSVIPGGGTAMGLGLQDGMAKITDPLRARVVVLFTDGEQNMSPQVAITGCSYSDGSPINPTCPGTAGSVKIIAVGIGSPSGLYHTTLQALANQNRGKLIITDNGTDFTGDCTGDITSVLDCAIAPALFGNSPQMVTSFKGKLSVPVTLPAFDINKNVSQLLIKISLSRKFELPALLSILADVRIMKDGIDITRYFHPVFPGNPPNSVLLKTNFNYQRAGSTITISPEGSYTIKMAAPTSQSPDLTYRVVPWADDHRLDMDWRVKPSAPRVNQPFNPTVSLSWRGKPLTNAKVEAWILKPGDDLGDLLARHLKKVKPQDVNVYGSAGVQKYNHLLEKDPKFLDKLRPGATRLKLVHQGGGKYSVSYNPGEVSGIYQIVYRVRAESAEYGRIQRKAVQSVYTRFGGIDLDRSAVSNAVQDNTVTINMRPITNYGRFIGPAQGGAITVDGDDIKLRSIIDQQDGSYTLILTGNPDAQIAIKLLGEIIYQGPASKFGEKAYSKKSLTDS